MQREALHVAASARTLVPTELWRDIWLRAQGQGDWNSKCFLDTSIAISHVSRFWRAQSLALPELWNLLEILIETQWVSTSSFFWAYFPSSSSSSFSPKYDPIPVGLRKHLALLSLLVERTTETVRLKLSLKIHPKASTTSPNFQALASALSSLSNPRRVCLERIKAASVEGHNLDAEPILLALCANGLLALAPDFGIDTQYEVSNCLPHLRLGRITCLQLADAVVWDNVKFHDLPEVKQLETYIRDANDLAVVLLIFPNLRHLTLQQSVNYLEINDYDEQLMQRLDSGKVRICLATVQHLEVVGPSPFVLRFNDAMLGGYTRTFQSITLDVEFIPDSMSACYHWSDYLECTSENEVSEHCEMETYDNCELETFARLVHEMLVGALDMIVDCDAERGSEFIQAELVFSGSRPTSERGINSRRFRFGSLGYHVEQLIAYLLRRTLNPSVKPILSVELPLSLLKLALKTTTEARLSQLTGLIVHVEWVPHQPNCTCPGERERQQCLPKCVLMGLPRLVSVQRIALRNKLSPQNPMNLTVEWLEALVQALVGERRPATLDVTGCIVEATSEHEIEHLHALADTVYGIPKSL